MAATRLFPRDTVIDGIVRVLSEDQGSPSTNLDSQANNWNVTHQFDYELTAPLDSAAIPGSLNVPVQSGNQFGRWRMVYRRGGANIADSGPSATISSSGVHTATLTLDSLPEWQEGDVLRFQVEGDQGGGGGRSFSIAVNDADTHADAELAEPAEEPNSGSGIVAAEGALVGVGKTNRSGAGTVAAEGVLVGAGSTPRSGSGVVQAEGVLTGAGQTTRSGSGIVAAEGVLVGAGQTPTATEEKSGSGVVAAEGVLVGAGHTNRSGSGVVAAEGALVGSGRATRSGSGVVAAEGTLIGAGEAPSGVNSGSGVVAAEGVLVGAGQTTRSGSGEVSAVGVIEGVGYTTRWGSGVVAAEGVLVGAGYSGLDEPEEPNPPNPNNPPPGKQLVYILKFGNHGVTLPVVTLGTDEDLSNVGDYILAPTDRGRAPLVVVEFNTSATTDQVVIAARYDGAWVEVAELVAEVA